MTLTLRLRRDAVVEELEDGRVRIQGAGTGVALARPPAALRALLRRLADGPVPERAIASAEFPAIAAVAELDRGGWLERTLCGEGGAPRATLRPGGAGRALAGEEGRSADPPRLSRFTVLRRDGAEAVVESPRGRARLVLHDPELAARVAALAAGGALPDDRTTGQLFDLLRRAGCLADDAEDAEQRFAQWTLPDLLLHQRSRLGRHADDYGGTFRLRGRFDPPPPLRPTRGEVFALPPPATAGADPPFQDVVERRRSLRTHDDSRPLTAAQLAMLLHRAARSRGVFDGHDYAADDRPYPSGGAMRELELYPVVRLCHGLEAGVFRYVPERHALERVGGPGPDHAALLRHARAATGVDGEPQVLIVLAARVGRVMWKYDSMAYALTLKHVGVLMHQLCLISTALGIACSPLGGGDSETFARATGLDPYVEPSVGELIVGSAMREDASDAMGAGPT